MDTISSRESNTNFLPMAGIAVGAIALIFAVIALVKLTSMSKEITDTKNTAAARFDSIDSQFSQLGPQLNQLNQLGPQLNTLGTLAQAVNETKTYAGNVAKGTNDGFAKVSDELTQIKTRIDRLEATRGGGRPIPPRGQAPNTTTNTPAGATASAGVYTVKSGDTGVTIARVNGVKLAELMSANPDVNWTRLRVGQAIKLPSAAPAATTTRTAQPAQ